MNLRFPHFEKNNAYYLFQEVGRYSKYISIFTSERKSDCEPRRYHVAIHDPSPEDMEASSSLRAFDFDDLMAIHKVLQEMVATKERMERGEVVGSVRISAKSKKLIFTLFLDSESALTLNLGEDGKYKKDNPKPRSPSTGNICVSLKIGRKHFTVGSINFFGGLRSALLLAHDLEVVMALVEGKPPLDILKMKPKTPVNPFTKQERESSYSLSAMEIDWDEVRRTEKEDSAYLHDLKMQIELEHKAD